MADQLNISFNIDSVENESLGTKRRERIKDGISCYRILPPFGTNHGGNLSHKYTVHWGFMGANGKERSITCSYPTEGYCPVCQAVREAEEELKRAQVNGDKEKAEEIEKYISTFRAKKFWLYNAVTADGRVIILELGWTAHDSLSKKISEAVRRKVGAFDPASPDSGVWFQFNRSGKGFNTEYSVDYKKISVDLGDGSIAEKPDRTPLDQDLISQIKESLASQEGLLQDIHRAHEPTTSKQLRDLMRGGVIQTKSSSSVSSAVSGHDTKSEAPASKAPLANPTSVQDEINRLKALQG